MRTLARAAGACARAVGDSILWAVWLVLCVLLAVQLRIASTHEITVPEFVLRRIEQKLTDRGIRATSEKIHFDPHGHVSLEGLTLGQAQGVGPMLKCARVDIDIAPWLALAGFFEPSQVRIADARIELPAMLSPTGTDHAIATGIECLVSRDGDLWRLEGLHARLANIEVEASGALPTIPKASVKSKDGAVPEWPRLLRQFAAALSVAEGVHGGRVRLRLFPDGAEGLWASVTASADSIALDLPDPQGRQDKRTHLALGPTRVSTVWPGPSRLPDSAEIETRDAAVAEGSVKRLAGRIWLTAGGAGAPAGVSIRRIQVAAWDISAANISLPYLRANALPDAGAWSARLQTRLWDTPIEATGTGQLATRSGDLSVRTVVSQSLLDGLGARLNKPFGTLLKPAQPAPVELSASFGAGGHLSEVHGWLLSGPVDVRGVPLDAAGGELSIVGHDLRFDRIVLRTGDSLVHGSYWMDTQDFQYRFLLSGRLQPPSISGWFHGWWPRFWKNFVFDPLPQADADVFGRWGHPDQTKLFISVDALKPKVRLATFDHVMARLFIRPHFYDAVSIVAEADGRRANAQFTRLVDLEKNGLVEQSFAANANLPFQTYEGLFGIDASEVLEPFSSELPPLLNITGTLRGPASPKGPGRDVAIGIRAPSRFRVYGFPLADLKCEASLHDNDLHVRDLAVSLAGGRITGEFTLAGKSPTRTLTLDAVVTDARLGEVIQTLDEFGLNRKAVKGEPAKPEGKVGRFQRENADGILNGFVKATGVQSDAYSFTGFGQASITHAKLAEINLLGQLSQALRGIPLLNFTSFSLTQAKGDFELARDRVHIPKLTIAGPSAEIQANGDYFLKTKEMKMEATVFPFAESRNPLATTVGFVLSPLSQALELQLEGSLEHPKWHFSRGPTELFRKLLPSENRKSGESPQTPAQPPPLLRRQ